jgi:vitamin B12 transporter
LYRSQRRVRFEIPTFFVDTDRHERTHGGDIQVQLPQGFLVGGSFNRDRLDSRDITLAENNYVASVHNEGVFLQQTLTWSPVTLVHSERYDRHSVVGESVNPRLQLLADATPWLRFSGSAARSFRAPTIDDLYTPFQDFGFGFSYVGNPNLRPEKSWTYDAGFELHQGSSSFRAGYFRANISDLIQTTADFAATTINIGRARRQGVELELSHAVNHVVQNSVNYTYLENLGVPPGSTAYVPLRLSPRHAVNYLATLKPLPGLSVDNTFRFRSARFEGNNETGTKLGSYVLWDLRIAYELRNIELFAGVNDLTNKRYLERSGFPLPGRNYFGGVTLKL